MRRGRLATGSGGFVAAEVGSFSGVEAGAGESGC